jgi:hypothetical protein
MHYLDCFPLGESPPFFLTGMASSTVRERRPADLLVDLNQLLRQGLNATKLDNFLFGFAYGGGRRQGLSVVSPAIFCVSRR